MKNTLQWKEGVILAKEGNINGFEIIYIMSYPFIYQKVFKVVQNDKQTWDLMYHIYKDIYEKILDMPDGKQSKQWILSLIKKHLDSLDQQNNTKNVVKRNQINVSEESATTVLLRLEEEFNSIKNEEREVNKLITVVKLATTVFLLTICFIFVFKISKIILKPEKSKGIAVNNIEVKEENDTINSSEVELLKVEDQNEHEETEELISESIDQTGWIISDQLDINYYDQKVKLVTGNYIMDGYEFIFNDGGQLLYFNDIDSSKFDQYSILKMDDWSYYKHWDEQSQKVNLYRTKENDSSKMWKELVKSDICSFYIVNNCIFYTSNDELKVLVNANEYEFTGQEQELHLVKEVDGFYLTNELNYVVFEDLKDSHMQMEDRVYRIKEGRIKYVKPNILPIKGVTYYIDSQDSYLYWKNTKGESGRFVTDGLAINSFCIVGKWVYYSVFTREEASMRYSQIKRISTDGLVREQVTDEFQGNFINMYYYQNQGRIYGEYLPEKSQYGKIAVISLDGTGRIHVIDDNEERTGVETTGEDMLELIMVENGLIYCYWHDCDWKNSSGVKILWTKPIILLDHN